MAEKLYSDINVLMPELANVGPHSVGVTTIEIDGPNLLLAPNGRKLTLEVWYPSAEDNISENKAKATYADVTRAKQAFTIQGNAFRGAKPSSDEPKYPLVVLSHGYTGYRSIMFYLGEHLASHGYVVASIDHTDSTNQEIDFKNNGGSGFHSTLLHRSRDQQAVLKHFAQHADTFGANSNASSVIGYSMGGYGALNTVGGCHSFSEQSARAFGFDPIKQAEILRALNNCNAGLDNIDLRWKAMVAIAPWGGNANVVRGLKNIKTPSLFIAGKEDDVSGYEDGVKKLYDDTGAKHKYLMVYEHARHNIAPHPAPAVAYNNELALGHYHEPAWNTENLNHINKHMILAFLNCHVRGDENFCAMLPTTESITQHKLENGELSPAWPGFKDRFGVGVLFYRK